MLIPVVIKPLHSPDHAFLAYILEILEEKNLTEIEPFKTAFLVPSGGKEYSAVLSQRVVRLPVTNDAYTDYVVLGSKPLGAGSYSEVFDVTFLRNEKKRRRVEILPNLPYVAKISWGDNRKNLIAEQRICADNHLQAHCPVVDINSEESMLLLAKQPGYSVYELKAQLMDKPKQFGMAQRLLYALTLLRTLSLQVYNTRLSEGRHGDIKDENIQFDPNSDAFKMLDFGLAGIYEYPGKDARGQDNPVSEGASMDYYRLTGTPCSTDPILYDQRSKHRLGDRRFVNQEADFYSMMTVIYGLFGGPHYHARTVAELVKLNRHNPLSSLFEGIEDMVSEEEKQGLRALFQGSLDYYPNYRPAFPYVERRLKALYEKRLAADRKLLQDMSIDNMVALDKDVFIAWLNSPLRYEFVVRFAKTAEFNGKLGALGVELARVSQYTFQLLKFRGVQLPELNLELLIDFWDQCHDFEGVFSFFAARNKQKLDKSVLIGWLQTPPRSSSFEDRVEWLTIAKLLYDYTPEAKKVVAEVKGLDPFVEVCLPFLPKSENNVQEIVSLIERQHTFLEWQVDTFDEIESKLLSPKSVWTTEIRNTLYRKYRALPWLPGERLFSPELQHLQNITKAVEINYLLIDKLLKLAKANVNRRPILPSKEAYIDPLFKHTILNVWKLSTMERQPLLIEIERLQSVVEEVNALLITETELEKNTTLPEWFIDEWNSYYTTPEGRRCLGSYKGRSALLDYLDIRRPSGQREVLESKLQEWLPVKNPLSSGKIRTYLDQSLRKMPVSLSSELWTQFDSWIRFLDMQKDIKDAFTAIPKPWLSKYTAVSEGQDGLRKQWQVELLGQLDLSQPITAQTKLPFKRLYKTVMSLANYVKRLDAIEKECHPNLLNWLINILEDGIFEDRLNLYCQRLAEPDAVRILSDWFERSMAKGREEMVYYRPAVIKATYHYLNGDIELDDIKKELSSRPNQRPWRQACENFIHYRFFAEKTESEPKDNLPCIQQ